ncbi:2-hydroxyacyl-CoA dehydratase subunit D [Calderihabitans maritimus]|uniref:Benzoyl-CoA reductase, gamma subunit n=1 Tax=Calderihabitans maritimus TaxID=1246530 RepID=A0A1Z5HTN1_9FIRM|nr:2-hydroxyacyl-CoA dehydratase family protein [Calderihabitans maritimus]GAW92630.1 benzoyl-CoA reductase, gamma subunit [Calderihabitans maritimus]
MVIDTVLSNYSLELLLPVQNPFINKWQSQGKKVFGYFCKVPKELLHAAGILPIRLLGTFQELKETHQHFPPVFCHYARSVLELGLNKELSSLDGIIGVNMCDTIVHIVNALETSVALPHYHFLNRPHDAGVRSARIFFRKEVIKLKNRLETITGTPITPDQIKRSVELYNQIREMVKKIEVLRGKFPQPKLSGSTAAQIALIGQVIPPEENLKMLKQIPPLLAKQDASGDQERVRIHLSGSVLQDLSLYQLIEETGGTVVSDDLCSGSRFFGEQIELTDDPLFCLSDYYLQNLSCPVMHTKGEDEKRLQDILSKVEQHHAEAVIFSLQKFCDPHQFDLPYLLNRLREAGIPVMTVEVDRSANSQQLRTRLQAFFETIRGGSL